jgi:hypothetical protein
MKTLVSQLNHFEPSFERGNFLNWAKYGDIPSTHGDIPVVFCLVYVIESSKSTKNWVFSKFLPTLGALFWLLQVSRMQVITTCTFFKYGFSLDAKVYPIMRSYKNHPRSYYQPFPVFFSFANILAHTNHSQETRGLGSSITLEYASRRNTHFLKHQSHTLISNLNRSLAGRRRLTARLRVSPYHRVRSLLIIVCRVFLILQ